MILDASALSFSELNEAVRRSGGTCRIRGCLGQRFLGAGLDAGEVTVEAYLNGATIRVAGNAQDAVGDTMNGGTIAVDGRVGDAAGYAMRGGAIYVRGDAGYRAGVHMKAYGEKRPVLIIGGRAGSFLGEYQAGGLIAVLGLDGEPGRPIVGNFPCTGMHGGEVFLRSDCRDVVFPAQVTARPAAPEDLERLRPAVEAFCRLFGLESGAVLAGPFTLVTPDSSMPYRQMYVAN